MGWQGGCLPSLATWSTSRKLGWIGIGFRDDSQLVMAQSSLPRCMGCKWKIVLLDQKCVIFLFVLFWVLDHGIFCSCFSSFIGQGVGGVWHYLFAYYAQSACLYIDSIVFHQNSVYLRCYMFDSIQFHVQYDKLIVHNALSLDRKIFFQLLNYLWDLCTC